MNRTHEETVALHTNAALYRWDRFFRGAERWNHSVWYRMADAFGNVRLAREADAAERGTNDKNPRCPCGGCEG